MTIVHPRSRDSASLLVMALLGAAASACSGNGSPSNGSGGAVGVGSGGALGSGGAPAASGGASAASGGTTAASGGAPAASGGKTSPGSGGTAGSTVVDAGTSPDVPAGGDGTACTTGPWPAADPTMAGPFATVTETNVGPTAGVGVDGGAPLAFTMFRPKDLAQTNLCHPVITWGNGAGSNPSLYKVLLGHLASHGFVVIASDSPHVSQGSPAPMVVGVNWVLAQNDDPSSVLYHRIDTGHVGATGHSEGGFATTSAGSDSHITTIAGMCGGANQRNLHGPAMLFCGGMDMTVPCMTLQNSYNAINNQPAMLADYLSADHANWITFRGSKPSVAEATLTAWMRVHLMNDMDLRPWFYGASCKLCTDPAWQVMQKMMD